MLSKSQHHVPRIYGGKTYYTKCHFMAKRLLSQPSALPPTPPPLATTFTVVTSPSTSNKWSESVYNAIQHLWNNKWHNLSRALCVQRSPRSSLSPSLLPPRFTSIENVNCTCISFRWPYMIRCRALLLLLLLALLRNDFLQFISCPNNILLSVRTRARARYTIFFLFSV